MAVQLLGMYSEQVCNLQPRVSAFSGGGGNPACQDPSVVAFSNDENAQTPQSSNGNLPACPEPPSPPPPSPGKCCSGVEAHWSSAPLHTPLCSILLELCIVYRLWRLASNVVSPLDLCMRLHAGRFLVQKHKCRLHTKAGGTRGAVLLSSSM